jgi:hypothetical protein
MLTQDISNVIYYLILALAALFGSLFFCSLLLPTSRLAAWISNSQQPLNLRIPHQWQGQLFAYLF